MDTIQIDGALLEASESEDLVRSGVLVPYGVECRSSIGRFTVEPGVFTIPADTSAAVVNVEHDRTSPVAVFASLHEEPRGIVGRLKFANTPEGRQAYADSDPKSGRLRSLSVEAKGVLIAAGKATAGAVFGGALVPKPAFAGADLFAAEDTTVQLPDGEEVPAHTESTTSATDTTSDGSQQSYDTTTTEDVQTADDGTVTITRTTVTVTTTTPPADTTTTDTTTTQGDQTVNATPAVPATLTASHTTPPAKVGTSLRDLNVLLAAAHAGDMSARAKLRDEGTAGADLYAALSDVKATGAGTFGAAIQPQWVGEAYNKATFERRYVPLFAHADLTGFSVEGFRWTTPPVMAEWAGNKAAVPSAGVAVDPTSHDAKNYAGAHDVDRRLRDFATPEFWDGYWRHMSNSYNKLTDADALASVVAAATAVPLGSVAGGISRAAAAIVDGYLAVQDEGVPTFAVLAPDLWRDLLLTPKDQTLEYLSVALSLDEGSIQAFRIVPARATDLAASRALVGIGAAATVYELPGSPLRVEGLDMVKGGIDPGAFGYEVTVVDDGDAFALVDATPAAG